MDQLPKNFKLVSVFAIVIGILGVLGGLGSAVTIMVGGKAMSDPFAAIKQPSSEMQKVADEMMAESVALSDSWRVPNGIIALGNMAVFGTMLGAGIMVHRVRRGGRSLLSKACLVAMIYEPLAMIPALILTTKTMAIQQKMTAAMADGAAPEVGQITSIVLKVSMFTGLAFLVAWVGAKVWYYVWARKRMVQPDVDEFFAKYGS